MVKGYLVGDEDCNTRIGGDGDEFGAFGHARGEGYGEDCEIGHGRWAE